MIDYQQYVPKYLATSETFSTIITDMEGNYAYVNDTFKRRFSFLGTHFIGESFTNSVYYADVSRANEAAWECIQNPEKPVIVELRKPSDNDKFYWTQWEFSLLVEEEQPIGIICVGQDVTESRRSAGMLHELNTRVEGILNSTPDAYILFDSDFKLLSVNKAAAAYSRKFFGIDINRLDKLLDLITEDEKDSFEVVVKKALSGKSIKFDRAIGKSWVGVSIFAAKNYKGDVIGCALTITDITETKKKGIRLKESELQLQKTVEAIPHPLLILNEDTTIAFVNDEFERVLGYASHEVLGQKIDFLIPKEYRKIHQLHHDDYMADGGILRRMGRFLPANTKGAQTIYTDISINTYRVKSRTQILVIMQDLTDQKKWQETIIKQNERLKAIAWQQSHELRRPVANILGIVELLKNTKLSDPQESKEIIRLLGYSADELDAIIKDIVDKTVDEAG
ncbi:MAG: PAS domain S-box protein [Cyclobacteriaceae bacterium]|nr:PAS domain S-box protein [Cyclobacteriaceae bacterium]MCH8517053.1 PAS domain S-box protein [Cyclobacteriaceae bacterium]